MSAAGGISCYSRSTAEYLQSCHFQMPVEAPDIAEIRCERCGRPMAEGTHWCPSCGKLNATTGARLVFIAFIIVIIAGFGAIKAYVSYLRGLESSLAQRWYARGDEAMAKGYPAVAAEDYRNALGYDASDRGYSLKLAEALMKQGRLAEARAYLLNLWSKDPVDGPLNLDLARLYAQQNKPDLAVRYYRAAIDGVWSSDPLQHRIDTRFELVQYLVERGGKARATAELIAIQAESPEDPVVDLKLGDLLLTLGESSRAAKSFDAVLKKNPKNVAALSGAGQAALGMGDYLKAVRLLTTADDLTGSKPDSPEADQLAVAREALDADPFMRNLTVTQRANRVAAAFDLAMRRLRSCASRQKITLSPESPASCAEEVESGVAQQAKWVRYLHRSPGRGAQIPCNLLYDSGTQKEPSARADALRRNPDAMGPTMDFVFEVMHATEKICPAESLQERALQLIARHEERGSAMSTGFQGNATNCPCPGGEVRGFDSNPTQVLGCLARNALARAFQRARRAVLPGGSGDDRNRLRTVGGCLPHLHRPAQDQAAGQRTAPDLPARGSGACADGPGGRIPGHPVLSAGTRQRRESDQGRALHLRRLHSVLDHHRQVHHRGVGDRRRSSAGTGRSIVADWGGNCLSRWRADCTCRARSCG